MRQTKMSDFFKHEVSDLYCPPGSEIADVNLYQPTGCKTGETPFLENGTYCCDEPLDVGRTQEEFWDRQNNLYFNPDLKAAADERAQMFKRRSLTPQGSKPTTKKRRLSGVPQRPLPSPESFVDDWYNRMKWREFTP